MVRNLLVPLLLLVFIAAATPAAVAAATTDRGSDPGAAAAGDAPHPQNPAPLAGSYDQSRPVPARSVGASEAPHPAADDGVDATVIRDAIRPGCDSDRDVDARVEADLASDGDGSRNLQVSVSGRDDAQQGLRLAVRWPIAKIGIGLDPLAVRCTEPQFDSRLIVQGRSFGLSLGGRGGGDDGDLDRPSCTVIEPASSSQARRLDRSPFSAEHGSANSRPARAPNVFLFYF